MAVDMRKIEDGRTALVSAAASLLIGPLSIDEVIESAPVDTYLTGILWPRGTAADPGDDEGDLNADGSAESGGEAAVPGYRAIRPCSIGLTFAVATGARVSVSLGHTARYRKVKLEAEAGDADTAARYAWARKPLGTEFSLPMEKSVERELKTSEGEPARIAVHVKRRIGPEQDVYTVTLVNESGEESDSSLRDEHCLFQAELVITASTAGKGVIQPRPMAALTGSNEDALINALLYRDVREFAVGHGIAAVWSDEVEGSVSEVRTAWLPQAHVNGTNPNGHVSLKAFRDKHPDALKAKFLGDQTAKSQVTRALFDFADCYERWIEQQLGSKLELFVGDFRTTAELNMQRCMSTLKRMRAGVTVLKDDEDAWIAFALANSAMDQQSDYPSKGKDARPLVWRPFQLAFMLLVIPGLCDPSREERQCMDLLWFPTGGGKTEAYLALTAFQIFHRRLQDEGRRKRGGVDVLMRYTLRLLTVQQFQRAAALIAASDAIRRSDPRLGEAPITLGLYVGGEATPNAMAEARTAIGEELAGQKPKSTPRQLLRCPVCGSDLHASAYRPHATQPRLDIVCDEPTCPTAGVTLPVLTVDEAIYANPPSLLIGTIDKFAQIPRRTDIRSIFGLDEGLAPGLIIQDELHLISGPLGSMAGLYESAIDLLCTRGDVRPKVIGSTATIGHAAAQVRALFDRTVLQFPPPGFDAGDSFFAVRDTVGPDRLYLGIPTAGRSPKFALQALVAALLQVAGALKQSGKVDSEAVDPYWTCVAYFNSLRELGGADVLMQDDVPRQMQFLAGRLGLAKRPLRQPPMELSSRRSSRELPALLHELGTTLSQYESDPAEYDQPPDNVLASNMISVGVDVPRLGLMVVNGQPKSTAEYIQASSRVGRGIPGLVVTLYNFGRPRDLSHFEHFPVYHGALYRSVEATSVTPWAPRARDKALHAALVSVMRHLVPGLLGDEEAANFDPLDPRTASLANSIVRRVVAAVGVADGADTKADLDALIHEWGRRSHEARTTNGRLRYWKKKAPFGRTLPHLMSSAEEGARPVGLSWPTPNTMREVEPSSAFLLRTIKRTGDTDGNAE